MSQYKVMGNFVYWEVPDEAARLSLIPSAAERYKVCYQKDTFSLFLLIATKPPTWQEIGMSSAVSTTTSRYDKVDATTAYLGKASVGSSESSNVWRIQKILFASDGDITILFADGDSSFDNIWANRASLFYS